VSDFNFLITLMNPDPRRERESGENRQISPEAQWWSSAREKWPKD